MGIFSMQGDGRLQFFFLLHQKKAETLYMVFCQTFFFYIYCLESSADVNLLNISPETSGSPLITSLMVIEPVMI